MKILGGLKNSSLILTAALSVSLGFVPTAFATSSWLIDPHRGSVIQLGSLGGDTYANDINDAGQVVGYSYTTTGLQHAFITGHNGLGITDLGTLGGAQSAALGINASGQVVGVSELEHKPNLPYRHAFITGSNGVGMRDLGTLPESIDPSSFEHINHDASVPSSYAIGINDSGQVAGASQKFFYFSNYGYELYNAAFITGPNGVGMRDIGFVYPSSAVAINNSGQVVGVADPPPRVPSDGTGFITGPDGRGSTALDTISDDRSYSSTAFPSGINDAGQVVGNIHSTSGEFGGAFITGPNGVGPIELNFMPGTVDDPNFINPTDINNKGEVVGYIHHADGSTQIPFITGPNGVGATDLNSLVHMPAGVVLTQAIAINNLGYVIALSPVSTVPEPSSYALMLAGLALINFMLRRASG